MSESIGIADLLEDALARSCDELVRETNRVPIDHWNESVFRFLVVRNLLDERPDLDCRTEWKRVDLMLFLAGGAVPVEFKFFDTRAVRDHSGNQLGRKGGPGKKNWSEFKSVVDSIHRSRQRSWAEHSGTIRSGFLILAHIDRPEAGTRRSYEDYYGDLQDEDHVSSIRTIADRQEVHGGAHFTCRLLEIDLA